MESLAHELMASPVGAALSMELEREQRTGRWTDDVVPEAVVAASEAVVSLPIGTLLAGAVCVGSSTVGSWVADAPLQVAAALRDAEQRSPIAAAVADRLERHSGAGRHEWWWSDTPLTDDAAARPRPLGSERRPCEAWMTATWDGLWTVTEPPPAAADELVSAWEMWPGPVTRWQLTADESSRIYEIDGPADWERLVRAHPLARPVRPNSSWEIPGPDRAIGAGHPLLEVGGQRAAAAEMRMFVEPDWDSVAGAWDAVHLSWRGFLTTEGVVIDLGDGDVTMLRNWSSERTLWLNPVLADPRPLDAPALEAGSEGGGAHPEEIDGRVDQDLATLRYRLGL